MDENDDGQNNQKWQYGTDKQALRTKKRVQHVRQSILRAATLSRLEQYVVWRFRRRQNRSDDV